MSKNLLNISKILPLLSYQADVVVLNTVNSTNQYLLDNIFYLKSGFVCLAEEQTQGRGQYGKYWLSPFGKNIYLSFYWFLSDYHRIELLTILSVVISVLVGKVLQSLGIKGIEVKWPNDIYFKGKKLAGILIEIISRFRNCIHVVIGIGINTTQIYNYSQYNSSQDSVLIISLDEIGISIDRNILAGKVINALYRLLIKCEYSDIFSLFSRWCFLTNFSSCTINLFI